MFLVFESQMEVVHFFLQHWLNISIKYILMLKDYAEICDLGGQFYF